MTRHRVLVADDHPLFREGVARTLAESTLFEVAGTAASGAEAVEQASRLAPDLVLLDLSMPQGGLWALERIARLEPAPVAVMLTVSEDSEAVFAALEGGARGYLLKGIGGTELVAILQRLMEGESHVAPALAARMLTRMHKPQDAPPDPLSTLTAREEEILRLVSAGLSNKEVARRLDLQERTIKHHMTQILQKLHLRNRTEAAILAQRRWGDG
ncbi:DNA-binding response regulator [Paracoccus acridae]|uniref:DNA-binding response regulator n=1 Tax=Paracoccus acridae TaxID=1795310 RepID=A0ABQ1VLR8_9RHOB|nr:MULTISPECIES: response regulator transcription factor [Paracoccus]GGF73898.1 DNA-binding response regulator [Paracoccus acridae]